MEDWKKQDRNLQDQYFGKCKTGNMQDWSLKDHLAGAMALSPVK